MCCITVDLHVEYVSAAGQGMVRTLDLGLVLRSTFVVDRHVVGVGVVILVCYTRDYAELLLVSSCETSCKTFSRSREHTVIVSVGL